MYGSFCWNVTTILFLSKNGQVKLLSSMPLRLSGAFAVMLVVCIVFIEFCYCFNFGLVEYCNALELKII